MKLISACCNSPLEFVSYDYVASPKITESSSNEPLNSYEYKVTMYFKCQKCEEERKIEFESCYDNSVDVKSYMIKYVSLFEYYGALHAEMKNEKIIFAVDVEGIRKLRFLEKLKILFGRTKK